MERRQFDLTTRMVRAGVGYDVKWRSVSTPIYQTAIFEHQRPLAEGADQYNYTRLGNPTRTALEEAMADLEGGFAAYAFTSGMAAIAAVLHLFRPGDHIIATEGLYGHTFGLMQHIVRPTGVDVTFVDTSNRDAVLATWTEKTAGVFVEMPTNPLLNGSDIRWLASVCKERKARLFVDSTFLTPWGMRPLELGADFVIHSATKYLAGHNDTLAGVVVAKSPAYADDLTFIRMMTGAVLAPFDAWLTLRGLKTLAVRMERCQENAQRIAEWLQTHPAVTEVYYPGLPSHPSHALFKEQARSFGGMVSFGVRSPEAAKAVLNRTELILLAESLGGTETLITYPWSQTHGNMPPEEKERQGIHPRLLRLSVGIEHVDDIIADLDRALGAASA